MSEKVKAHEGQEATPLEELCPDVPGGLALVVQRMMAKRPADRFQSMAEVAEALSPYVAGSSASFRQMRHTATWDGSRLATMPAMPRRRRVLPWLVGGTALLSLLAIGLIGLAAGWFQPKPLQVAQQLETSPSNTENPPLPPADTGKSKPSVEPKPPDDPNVLTVSQKPEDGGKYPTIRDALEAVKPGQTIRIVDAEVYREQLALRRPSVQAGITLEAPGGAVLETASPRTIVLSIADVPGVTLRKLRLRSLDTERTTLVAARGEYSGLRIEDVELSATGSGKGNNGLELSGATGARPRPAPVVVQDCRFRNLDAGAMIYSIQEGDWAADLAVRNGLFTDCAQGVILAGMVKRVELVGNRFWGTVNAALQLQMLSPDSEAILIANNSCYESSAAFRLWDRSIQGKDVRICNNLVLASRGLDMVFMEAIDMAVARGLGDGAAVARAYRFDHNWRPNRASAEDLKGWIPSDPKKGDAASDRVDTFNRDPKSHDFLRPDPKSPLATAGAGNEDPSLPRYVGALPPEGTEPWDWDRTWRMPKDAQLLTVSKESSGGGKYRTINEALKDAKPWATIRVLDAASYEEIINLTDRKKYEGLTLEAVHGAALHMASDVRRLIVIEDVPHVCLAGFRCTEAGSMAAGAASRAFIAVSGAGQGIALTRLVLTPKTPMFGIILQQALAPPGELPLRVEQCVIRPECPGSNDGISVAGNLEPDATGGICIRSNRVFHCAHGINVRGSLHDVHVTGNLLVKCPFSGLQVEDVAPGSHGLVFANNTAFGGGAGFRFWDNSPYKKLQPGQVEVANNLFFAATDFDVAFILNDVKNQQQSPGSGEELLKMWHFHHNRRDLSGSGAAFVVPISADDGRFRRDEMLSLTEDSPDRVRPGKDSPLGSQGAGIQDGSLPAYIGALPPEGTLAWDWDRTWRARIKKGEEKK